MDRNVASARQALLNQTRELGEMRRITFGKDIDHRRRDCVRTERQYAFDDAPTCVRHECRFTHGGFEVQQAVARPALHHALRDELVQHGDDGQERNGVASRHLCMHGARGRRTRQKPDRANDARLEVAQHLGQPVCGQSYGVVQTWGCDRRSRLDRAFLGNRVLALDHGSSAIRQDVRCGTLLYDA